MNFKLLLFMLTISILPLEIDAQIFGGQIKSKKSLQIGDYYQGGIIAYIDGSGQHGFVVSLTEYSGLQGCYGNNAWSLTDGYTNTSQAFSGCNNNAYAIANSWNLSLNGFSDWYLPAINQLLTIYQNLISQNLISMSGLYYWSSTSDSTNWARVLRSNGATASSNKVGGQLNYRAIRNF